jgi:hypothetical protein
MIETYIREGQIVPMEVTVKVSILPSMAALRGKGKNLIACLGLAS